jgi:spore germination protein KA
VKYITGNYEIDRDVLRSDFKDCSDFLLREVKVSGERALLLAMDGLVDSLTLTRSFTSPVLESKLSFSSPVEHFEKIKACVAAAPEMNETTEFEELEFFLMSGFAGFILEGCPRALVLGVQGWNKRSTDEPTNEAMVKGAKECFTETINDNKALLRKRLKSPDLKLRQLKLGAFCDTPVVIAYIKGRAEPRIVSRIEKQLESAPLDAVQDYGCLNAFLEDKTRSPFSTVGNTERPDVLASKLLEGRVGIMTDGTPFVMYLPYLFTDSFSSLDDYDNPPFYAGFVRLLKYLSFTLSIFLPAFYVAIGSYHQEMIPAPLLYLIASGEEATPFPLAVEAVLIHILYEIMREAGLRLPRTVGHAVSIIGAIVIGEAMVSAGIISEPMLVVVALTAIASYAVYPLYESVAVLRIAFIVLAGITGIYAIVIGGCALIVNACSLSSCGVPFTAPLTPLTPTSLGDTLTRQSWRTLARRRVRISRLKGADGSNE